LVFGVEHAVELRMRVEQFPVEHAGDFFSVDLEDGHGGLHDLDLFWSHGVASL
jgi:hypothetical protein